MVSFIQFSAEGHEVLMLQAAFVFALIGLAFFGAYRATTPECCLLTDAVDKLFRLGGVSLIRAAPQRATVVPQPAALI